MKKINLLFSLVMIAIMTRAQINYHPDQVLLDGQQRAKVMVMGTFHFAYYNLDAHKTDPSLQVDILSPQKQDEMKVLINYISQFKPNKIVVESGPNTGYLMHQYSEYLAGRAQLNKNEIQQVGFRLMEKFGLDTIYGADAIPVMWELYDGPDSICMRPIFDTMYHEWDFQSDEYWSTQYDQYYVWDDSLSLQMDLLSYFQYMNKRDVLERGFGAYLVGDFNLGDQRGADALSMHWYNRNLRIYRNIQQIADSPDDRILVIFGQGHACILDYLFRCSPEFDYIPFNELGKE